MIVTVEKTKKVIGNKAQRSPREEKIIKLLTQDEIEYQEEKRKILRLQKLADLEFQRYFIVQAINKAWNENRESGIKELLQLDSPETISDPVIIELKRIIDAAGIVSFLKLMNNQYLKTFYDCNTSGRKDKIKVLNRYKPKPDSKKDIEKGIEIQNAIDEFILSRGI